MKPDLRRSGTIPSDFCQRHEKLVPLFHSMNERENIDFRGLVRKAKDGDGEAFGMLYEQYFTPVYRYIYFRVRRKEEAEDLTQTVFVKAFEAMPRFRDIGKDPLAFFFTVARNTVINHWRKKHDVLPDDPDATFRSVPDSGPGPERSAETNERLRLVWGAMSELTKEQREVITLRFVNELSNREIAAMLGKTEEAIRQLQARGLKSIRKQSTIYEA
ncbi:MAG: sigma-70 family RNA polymerase sigma factor [Patescibacteria group bacterium]